MKSTVMVSIIHYPYENMQNLKLLIFFGTIIIQGAHSNSRESLVNVQILFRHGDRNPIWRYPLDPYNNEPMFSMDNIGQLTEEGMRQHYALGHFLRERYDHFISRYYKPSDIKITATDVDRTIMSAEMNMAGLYPPQISKNWNHSIEWTPVPIRVIPKQFDQLLGMHKPCPKLDRVTHEILNSEYTRILLEDYKDFLEYVKVNTGTKGKMDTRNIATIRDTLNVEKAHHYNLPQWTKRLDVMQKLDFLSGIDMKLKTLTTEAKRLRSGPLLSHWVENMDRFSEGEGSNPSNPKIQVFSAHDSTLAWFMGTLDIFDPIPPPYASALIMELHKNSDGKYTVEVYFRNDTKRDPYFMDIPRCGNPCSLENLSSLTKALIPNDWERECSIQSFTSEITSSPIPLLIGCGTLMVALMTVSVAFIQHSRRIKIIRLVNPIYERI